MREEHKRRLANENCTEINWEVTERISKEEKYVKFNKWLKDNGVHCPSVRYPTAFGPTGGLIGISARRRIGPQEAYLYVPAKLTISETKVRQSEIGFIIDKHPEIFKDR